MQTTTAQVPVAPAIAKWKALVAEHQVPSAIRASWQILNTFGPYVGLWSLMYLCLAISWWLVIPLAIVSGALLVRVFIIFHDCGHGSFFASRRVNDVWGFLAGVLTFTPYYHWRWEHSIHHATAGQLDERGVGDIWTLTVEEYLRGSRWKRRAYRLARNPIVLFVIAPVFVFVFQQRLPNRKAPTRERRSVHWTNLAIALLAAGQISLLGFVPYLLIQLTVISVAGAAGIWLFYVQHQFEEAYWERGEDWDYTAAALKGSSYYKLPAILQWFSGNIGFHHIHHLSPRIPNYNLERCHRSDPLFRDVAAVTPLASLKLSTLRLWDESSRKLISIRQLRARERRARENSLPAAADIGGASLVKARGRARRRGDDRPRR